MDTSANTSALQYHTHTFPQRAQTAWTVSAGHHFALAVAADWPFVAAASAPNPPLGVCDRANIVQVPCGNMLPLCTSKHPFTAATTL